MKIPDYEVNSSLIGCTDSNSVMAKPASRSENRLPLPPRMGIVLVPAIRSRLSIC